MAQIRYLNGVLTVIAICLVLITLAVTGLIPKANASPNLGLNEKRFVSVPVNADGSINVKINDVMDVNIEEVGGYSTFGKVPVEVKN